MRPLLHRIAAVAAMALIGLTFAAPARAAGQEVTVTGTATCNPEKGEWLVSWTVVNSVDKIVLVNKLRTEPEPVSELTNGTEIPRRSPSGTNGRRIFSQTLPGGTPSAMVSFDGIWQGGKDTDNTATVALGECKPAETPCVEPAEAAFHHEFAVADGRATATVTVDDGVKLCADEPVTLVTYFAPKPEFSVPQYEFDHQSATITNDHRSVTLAATLPACNAQVDLFFGGEDDIIGEITEGGPRYGDKKLGSNGGPGGRSKGPQGWYNGGGRGCHTPAVEPVSQCDGTVSLHLSNTGEYSRYAVDFTVTAGDFTKSVTVAPGKAETVVVPAGAGRITVSADGMDDVKYEWQRPEDCPAPTVTTENDCYTVTVIVTNPDGVTPARATVRYGDATKELTVAPGASAKATFPARDITEATVTIDDRAPITTPIDKPDCPGGGNGGSNGGGSTGGGDGGGSTGGGDGGENGGGLPVTGAAAGAIAGGAILLLLTGGALFYLARRRRVTFTP
ncbi:cell wall anchor protein [Actinoplanes sp. NPDC049548]|uniref:cell wall anchor protein n=1 Tax=Actinoplanes sp. NPDC049548 TaxID=3155152 RepID=UPI003429E96A